MKAQLATIEALLSLIFISGIIAFGTGIINGYNANSYASREELAASTAIYDMQSSIYRNASIAKCVRFAASGNVTCIENYEKKSEQIYAINEVELIIDNESIGKVVDAQAYECFPYANDEICIIIGR